MKKVVCIDNIISAGTLIEDLVIGEIYDVLSITEFRGSEWYDLSCGDNVDDIFAPSSLFIDLDTHRQRLIDSILK